MTVPDPEEEDTPYNVVPAEPKPGAKPVAKKKRAPEAADPDEQPDEEETFEGGWQQLLVLTDYYDFPGDCCCYCLREENLTRQKMRIERALHEAGPRRANGQIIKGRYLRTQYVNLSFPICPECLRLAEGWNWSAMVQMLPFVVFAMLLTLAIGVGAFVRGQMTEPPRWFDLTLFLGVPIALGVGAYCWDRYTRNPGPRRYTLDEMAAYINDYPVEVSVAASRPDEEGPVSVLIPRRYFRKIKREIDWGPVRNKGRAEELDS